ncbi:MAG: transporter substrate-binding domain-containing protein [Spirochaetaceae bacterium]
MKKNVINTKIVMILVMAILSGFLLLGCEEAGSSGDPTLVVGHHQEPGQGVFTVDESGNAAPSLEKELILAVGQHTGFAIRFSKVDYPEPSFEDIEHPIAISEFFQAFADALDQGDVDVVIGNFWVLTKREEVVDFITPHLPDGVGSETPPVAFFVRKGNSELKTALDAAVTALEQDGTIENLKTKYSVE